MKTINIKKTIQRIEKEYFESGKVSRDHVIDNWNEEMTQFLTDKLRKKRGTYDTYVINRKEYRYLDIVFLLRDLDYLLFEYHENSKDPYKDKKQRLYIVN